MNLVSWFDTLRGVLLASQRMRGTHLFGGSPLRALSFMVRSDRRRRAQAERLGVPVPGYCILSVTSRCNLDCTGCYAKTFGADGDMPPGLVARILAEAEDLGVPYFLVVGGEPLVVPGLMELGGLRYFSVNLSTLDRERYRRDRGKDHLELVLRNLRYLRDLELAPLMEIVVLGRGDEEHRRDYEEICAHFQGSRFEVKSYQTMDRAGAVPFGLSPRASRRRLCGCDQTGSRPLQWLHITPYGKCLLCCQDYHEQYVVGDLSEETVAQVLQGERMARYRRWAYGVEEAPEDFICRRCIYARRRRPRQEG